MYSASKLDKFGVLPKKKAMLIAINSLLFAILYALGYNTIIYALIPVLLLIESVNDCFSCLGCYIVSRLYIGALYPSVVNVGLFTLVIVSLFLHNLKMIRRLKGGIFALASVVLVLLSSLFGINVDINNAIMMLLCIALVMVIYNASIKKEDGGLGIIIWAYIWAAIGMMAYYGLSVLRNGIIQTTYGRASFNDNIKSLAIVMAIGVSIILYTKMEGKALYKNFDFGFFSYILIIPMSAILILTTARGVIAALLISMIVFLLFSNKSQLKIWNAFPLVIFVIIFIISMLDSSAYRISRIFETEEFASMSGRTEIWVTHITSVLHSGPLHIILGVGPGQIQRINGSIYYAHSTFLDFFFCYGILGIIAILAFEWIILKKLLKAKDAVLLALFTLSVVMYSTHGGTVNADMYLLQITLLRLSQSFDESLQ